MKIFTTSILLTALFLALPLAALAETVVRTGESVSVSDTQVVEQDFYAYGGTVTQSGEIVGDMYVVGGSVTVNGPIGADLAVMSGNVQVHSTVGDDLRVFGGETVLAGEIKGDVFVIGGLLKILSSASVGGNVYFYGGELNTEGAIAGSVLGYADTFVINGSVDGGLDVKGDVELGSGAEIDGGVKYESASELVRAQDATVEGDINHLSVEAAESDEGNWWLVPSIIWAFTTLACYLFLRNGLGAFIARMKASAGKSGLVGISTFILLPILSFILMATVLGVWFGVVALLSWLLLFIIAMLLLPIFVGHYLFVLFKKKRELDVLTVIAGIVTTTILAMVPFFGGLFLFIGVIMVAGYMGLSLYRVTKEVL